MTLSVFPSLPLYTMSSWHAPVLADGWLAGCKKHKGSPRVGRSWAGGCVCFHISLNSHKTLQFYWHNEFHTKLFNEQHKMWKTFLIFLTRSSSSRWREVTGIPQEVRYNIKKEIRIKWFIWSGWQPPRDETRHSFTSESSCQTMGSAIYPPGWLAGGFKNTAAAAFEG